MCLCRAKPRIPIAGRRAYTEEELQAALRDIQSGKLGTRRAAVIYGIPRSTLRNKVYKLAMERERDSHLVLSPTPDLSAMAKTRALLDVKDEDDILRDDDEDDRDLSGAEEEREVEKALMKPLLSMEDLIRFSGDNPFPGSESLRTLLQHGSKFMTEQKKDDGSSSPVFPVFPPGADVWSGMDHSALGPYISRLLSGNINAMGHPNPFAISPAAVAATAGVTNRSPPPTERSPTDSPGGGGGGDFVPKFPPSLELVRRMMEERFIQEEQQKKDQRRLQLNGSNRGGEPGPSCAALIKQETIDENSGSATPPNVILRIPSFKPTSKNGVPVVEPPPLSSVGYPLTVKAGESSQHSVISPDPLGSTRSESSSPPSIGKGINVTLRDVIAKSISQKFQQPPELHHITHTPPGLEHYRRTEFTQPLVCNPPVTIRNHNNNHLEDRKIHPPSNKPATNAGSSNNSNSQGGKGTRPKRGKYRNYDRDSLVEAVRAVQRGEMSVHRAGSYYGVPHSTLEYKVKERHLMRPRKREPKPQPEEIKRKDEGNIVRMPPVDKCKPLPPPKTPKAPFTPPSPLPTGPNGLKISPLFDPSLTYGPAPPFPFWHPGPFHHLPITDYPRGSNFTPSPDQFFASQMIQRLQEDSARTPQESSPPALGQSARELAEKLYDGTGNNGSFLDGIIRSSLETGLPNKSKESGLGGSNTPEHMSNKALLDQLCRNSRITPLPKAGGSSVQETSSSDEEVSKRGVVYNQNRDPSPLISVESIKKEPEEDPLLLPSPRQSSSSSPHADTTSAATTSLRQDVNGMEVSEISKDDDCDYDVNDDVSACDSKQTMLVTSRVMDDVCSVVVAKEEVEET